VTRVLSCNSALALLTAALSLLVLTKFAAFALLALALSLLVHARNPVPRVQST
jgi:hypothetical protein